VCVCVCVCVKCKRMWALEDVARKVLTHTHTHTHTYTHTQPCKEMQTTIFIIQLTHKHSITIDRVKGESKITLCFVESQTSFKGMYVYVFMYVSVYICMYIPMLYRDLLTYSLLTHSLTYSLTQRMSSNEFQWLLQIQIWFRFIIYDIDSLRDRAVEWTRLSWPTTLVVYICIYVLYNSSYWCIVTWSWLLYILSK